MAYRRRRNRFNANEYWDSRPLCSICAARKTRSGTICHKCRQAGHVVAIKRPPAAPASFPPSATAAAVTRPASLSPVQSNNAARARPERSGFGVVAAISVGICFLLATCQTQPLRVPNTATPLQSQSRNNGDVYVRGHYRSDGTYVRPHVRTRQNHIFGDNFSTSGNRNPYSGRSGTRKTPNRGGVYLDRR